MATQQTWLDVARAVFPEADDATLTMYLWEYTPYPNFWHTDNPVAECRHYLTVAREAMARGAAWRSRRDEEGRP